MGAEDIQAIVPRSAGAVAQVEETRAIAEVKAAVFLARQFPRDEAIALQKIVADCGDLELASKAMYTYGRGGTEITGPSIRLAEAVARRWGNLQMGVREIERRSAASQAEAYCWDLEANVRDARSFEVPHVISRKDGTRRLLTDERDIYERVANDGARRKRASILAIVPKRVVDAAVEQCKKTLVTKDPVTPEKLKKMTDAFAVEFKITKEMIEKRFQRKLDAITSAQFIMLRGIYQALKDGVATPDDHFEVEAPASTGATQTAVEQLKTKLDEQLAKTEPAKSSEAEVVNAADEQVKQDLAGQDQIEESAQQRAFRTIRDNFKKGDAARTDQPPLLPGTEDE